MKKEVNISRITVIIFCFLLALGWLIAAHFWACIPGENLLKKLQRPILIIAETLILGVSVAFVTNRFLKLIFDDTDQKKYKDMGITVYKSRYDADEELAKVIRTSKQVDIIGISLRDFFHFNGRSRRVWTKIKERLREEEEKSVPSHKRFKVRILLLDPHSEEGIFRDKFEANLIGIGVLLPDVKQSIEDIEQAKRSIYGNNYSYLAVSLYSHCPFSFMFITPEYIFTEQYYYKNHSNQVQIPIVKYSKKEIYDEHITSFNHIWNNAKEGYNENEVGTASAISSAQIMNIYRRDQRYLLGKREAEIIKQLKKGDQVDILAITGNFFITPPMKSVLEKAACRGIYIRVALLNPLCEQAITRAVADSNAPTEIPRALKEWSWEKHSKSTLYHDINQSLKFLKPAPFDIRLFHASIASALVLTPKHAFIEQYLYGRSENYQAGKVLGGEYPIFEFSSIIKKNDGIINERSSEREMLDASFEVIWNSFSTDVEELPLSGDEEDRVNAMDIFSSSYENIIRWGDKAKDDNNLDDGVKEVFNKMKKDVETSPDLV